MSDCHPTPQDKEGAIVGLSVSGIIFLIFIILFIISLNTHTRRIRTRFSTRINPNPSPKTPTRLHEYGEFILSKFNLPIVIAVMISGVVLGFNQLIMTPIINTMFPNQTFANVITIPGTTSSIAPGQFLIALIGFIISLFILFGFIQLYFVLSKHTSTNKGWIYVGILSLLLFGLFVWNIVNTQSILSQPDCTLAPSTLAPSTLAPIAPGELRFPIQTTPPTQQPTHSTFGNFI